MIFLVCGCCGNLTSLHSSLAHGKVLKKLEILRRHKFKNMFCLNALTPVISSLEKREMDRLEFLTHFLKILFALPDFRCV